MSLRASLRGSLRGRVSEVFRGFERFLEVFRGFERFSEVFQRPLRDPHPVIRMSRLGPVFCSRDSEVLSEQFRARSLQPLF